MAKLPVIEFPLSPEKQSLPESDSEVELLLSARTLSAAESFEDALEDPVETLQGAYGGLSLADDSQELKGFRPPPRNPSFEQTPEDRQLVGPSAPPNLPPLRRTHSRKDQGNRRPLSPEGTSQKSTPDKQSSSDERDRGPAKRKTPTSPIGPPPPQHRYFSPHRENVIKLIDAQNGKHPPPAVATNKAPVGPQPPY